ncbi:hypothetical protein [Amycolatopsis benzoatilytica]|uniref:hypothetical protein n=1 Tax=Amycolatopsis benzoatilytica TaxID=346045 RepID=UPI000382E42A|nr:hypothetical protein [Amycolatopsis benzoatilytica]
MSTTTVLKDVFADAETTKDVGDRFERYKNLLTKAIERGDSRKDGFAPRVGIVKAGNFDSLAQRVADITKGLDADAAAQLQTTLGEMRADLGKDITFAGPQGPGGTTQLVPYDLEAPAKEMYPKFTPIRNELSRVRGQGAAREYKRINGVTNAGLGGVPDISPFFNSESDSGTPSFGSLTLRRGKKIQYAADDKVIPYVEMSLSDMVTYKAQFAGVGFEDVRQLSQHSLLWSHLLGEEKALLYGRGSKTGFVGAMTQPAQPTLSTATTGGTIAAATYSVRITARSGFGETAATASVTQATTGSTSTLTVNLPAANLPFGANIYIGPAGSEVLQGTGTAGQAVVFTSLVTGTAAAPAADSSADANGYDGLLTNALALGTSPLALNAKLGQGVYTTPGAEFQQQFLAMWNAVYADPDEVWSTAAVRNELGNQLLGSSSSNYRIDLGAAQNGKVIGEMVAGILNHASPTSKMVDLRVHPYMPSGTALIRSRTLPFPDNNVGETSQVVAVQEYMSVDWPQIQFTYDQSTYWFGTLVNYAPAWNSVITGIQ